MEEHILKVIYLEHNTETFATCFGGKNETICVRSSSGISNSDNGPERCKLLALLLVLLLLLLE